MNPTALLMQVSGQIHETSIIHQQVFLQGFSDFYFFAKFLFFHLAYFLTY